MVATGRSSNKRNRPVALDCDITKGSPEVEMDDSIPEVAFLALQSSVRDRLWGVSVFAPPALLIEKELKGPWWRSEFRICRQKLLPYDFRLEGNH